MNHREHQLPALPDSPIMKKFSTIAGFQAERIRNESHVININTSHQRRAASETGDAQTQTSYNRAASPSPSPLNQIVSPPSQYQQPLILPDRKIRSPPPKLAAASWSANKRTETTPKIRPPLPPSTRDTNPTQGSGMPPPPKSIRPRSGSAPAPPAPNLVDSRFDEVGTNDAEDPRLPDKGVHRKDSWSKIRNFYKHTKASAATIGPSISRSSSNSANSVQNIDLKFGQPTLPPPQRPPPQPPTESSLNGKMSKPPLKKSRSRPSILGDSGTFTNQKMPVLEEDTISSISQSPVSQPPTPPSAKEINSPVLSNSPSFESFRRQNSLVQKSADYHNSAASISMPILALNGTTGVQVYPPAPQKRQNYLKTRMPPNFTPSSHATMNTDHLTPEYLEESYFPLSPSVPNISSTGLDSSRSSILYPPVSPGPADHAAADLLSKPLPRGISIAEAIEKYDTSSIQKMILRGMHEASNFGILSPEELDDLSMEIPALNKRLREISIIYNRESRIREGTTALLYLHRQRNDKKAIKDTNAVLMTTNLHMEGVTTDLWQTSERLYEVRKKIVEHIAGALGIGLKKFDFAYKKLQGDMREVEMMNERNKRHEQEETARLELERNELEKRKEEHIRIRSLLFNPAPVPEEIEEETKTMQIPPEEKDSAAYLQSRLSALSSELASMHVQSDDARAEIRKKDQLNEKLQSELNTATDIVKRLLEHRQDPDFLIDHAGPSTSQPPASTSKRTESVTIFNFPKPPLGNETEKQSLLDQLLELEKILANYESRVQTLLEKKIAAKYGLQTTLNSSLKQVLEIETPQEDGLETSVCDSVSTSPKVTFPKKSEIPESPQTPLEVDQTSQEDTALITSLRALFYELPDLDNAAITPELPEKPTDDFTVDSLLKKMRTVVRFYHTLSTNVTNLEHINSQLRTQLDLTQMEQKELEANFKKVFNELQEVRGENEKIKISIRRLSNLTPPPQTDNNLRNHFQKQLEDQEQDFFVKLKEKDALIQDLQEQLGMAQNRVSDLEKTTEELDEMVRERDGRVQALLFAEGGFLPVQTEDEDFSDPDQPNVALNQTLSWNYVKEHMFLGTPLDNGEDKLDTQIS